MSRSFVTFVVVAAVSSTSSAQAQSSSQFETSAATRTASVTYGPYARFELGGVISQGDDAYWLPPGAADPQINFDIDVDNGVFGSAAIGFDWQNGFRAEAALLATSNESFTAPCSSASEGSPCAIHADITGGDIDTRALMGDVYFAPLEWQGSNDAFQPFIVAGLGVARNEMGPWTRENAGAPQPVRTFSGNTTTEFAWSIGLGASWQVTRPGRTPVLVEASWRYYDFGTAEGGSVPDVGMGIPRQPFTFENESQVVSIGVRIPLQRF